MFRMIVVALLATVCAGVAVVAEAEARRGSNDTLVTLARRDVSLALDYETIDVSKAKGAYRAIRITARRPIVISRVQIVYADGSVHNEDRRIVLNRGERTREINRTEDARFINRINIDYKRSRNAKGEVKLTVLGVRGPGDAKAKRPASGDIATAAIPGGPEQGAASGTVVGGGVLFGVEKIGLSVDHETIGVGEQIGKFDRIRLRVRDNDLFINELKIVYGRGEPDTIPVNAQVKKNSRTDWFELNGERFIKEIQLAYRSNAKSSEQARVEVFGDYASGWLKPNGEGRNYNEGWVLLGSQTAGFIGFDNAVIPVGRNEGGFKKFRVTVQDRAITLSELRIVYGNGARDIIPVRSRIDAGATYGPIDVNGGTRAVKEIRAKYRSRFFDKNAAGQGMALVQVWGHY